MPTYTEPTKTTPTLTEPSKTTATLTEPSKPTVTYTEPHWTGATWKNLKGLTWKDIIGLTWKGLFERFGNKISSPTYIETSKGTVSYTEPSKE